MRRDIFSDEHELFRSQFKRFAQAEIVPKIAGWDEKGMSDRATWKRMGEEGFLGANAPEAYGGAGADFLYDAIVMEELAYVRAHGLMMSLHSDICMPYITEFGTESQKQKYLPGDDLGRRHPGHRDDRAGHRLRSRERADERHHATATRTS